MQAGLLPFGTGYHSNHPAIFVVVNIDSILNTKIGAIQSITARKLIQASRKEQKIFIEEVDKHFNNQNLCNRLKKLSAVQESEWDSNHTEEFERCNQEMVKQRTSHGPQNLPRQST
jgi:ABC-type uncharacterized transport system fused permease/ATPase subunit